MRILVPFGGTAGLGNGNSNFTQASSGLFIGPYVWHCHILEHEEVDMMQDMVIHY